MKIFLQCLVVALVVAVCFSQASFAEVTHFHVKSVQKVRVPSGPPCYPTPDCDVPVEDFYGTAAYFASEPLNAPYIDTAGNYTNTNPWNGPWPGTASVFGVNPPDLWPCFGGDPANGSGNDCYYIGSAAGYSYPGGLNNIQSMVVSGGPSYTWYLGTSTDSNIPGYGVDGTSQPYGCEAKTVADDFHFCAQAINWYEDDTTDTTSDLLWSMSVTQAAPGGIIYDSGTQDYGPNPYGAYLNLGLAAPNIVFYEDIWFGIGPHGGAPNAFGPCFASYNYPAAPGPYGTYEGEVNTFGALFGISAGKTCVNPQSSVLATVSIETQLEAATWVPVTKKASCTVATMGAPPNNSSPYCYTVKYAKPAWCVSPKTCSVTQKFNIWLE